MSQIIQSDCEPNKLADLLNGNLPVEQQEAIEQHLSQCDACAQLLQQQAAMDHSWDDARDLLLRDEFDGSMSLSTVQSLSDESYSYSKSRCAEVLTREIAGWLDPTDDPLMLGRFAGYEIVGIVGHGGMAIVLKGFESSLNRFVAIKVMAPRLATNESARLRFAREAQAAAAVLHENVVAIHRVDEFHGLPFLVMPYIAGTSLQNRLDKQGPSDLKATLRIGAQIAAGLAAAHQQGLVHRDIKPANILMDPGVERIKITDFGLARTVDDASVTRTGIVAGTPQYMSPEQAKGESLDARSDLFSLGSLLYAVSTGQEPFRAETAIGLMRSIYQESPTPIRQLNPDLPVWLETIIDRMMAKRLVDRFQSASEVQHLLEDCLAHAQSPEANPLPVAIAKTNPKRPRKKIMLLAAIALLMTGLFGGVFAAVTTPPDVGGHWQGDDWGEVELVRKNKSSLHGTYTDTFDEEKGTLNLKWSRVERRFKGTWSEGDNLRSGKISIRLVDGEIRGAWTTNKKSEINPGVPSLSDLLWTKSEKKNPNAKGVVPGVDSPGPGVIPLQPTNPTQKSLPGTKTKSWVDPKFNPPPLQHPMIGVWAVAPFSQQRPDFYVHAIDEKTVSIETSKGGVSIIPYRIREPGTMLLDTLDIWNAEAVGPDQVRVSRKVGTKVTTELWQRIKDSRFATPKRTITTVENYQRERQFSLMADCFSEEAIEQFAGYLVHSISIAPATASDGSNHKITDVLRKHKRDTPSAEAKLALELLREATLGPAQGIIPRTSKEDYDDLIIKAAGLVKEPRDFVIEAMEATDNDTDSNANAKRPRWRFAVEGNVATGTADGEQGPNVLTLERENYEWKITRFIGQNELEDHVSGKSFFHSDYPPTFESVFDHTLSEINSNLKEIEEWIAR